MWETPRNACWFLLGWSWGVGWALCGCGGCFLFFLTCLGDWVEKFVFLKHRCVTCAVFMWMVRWSELLNDVNSQMKRHLLGDSLSRQICHASKPNNFFTLSGEFQNWPISWNNSRDIRDSYQKKRACQTHSPYLSFQFGDSLWISPVFLEPTRCESRQPAGATRCPWHGPHGTKKLAPALM